MHALYATCTLWGIPNTPVYTTPQGDIYALLPTGKQQPILHDDTVWDAITDWVQVV